MVLPHATCNTYPMAMKGKSQWMRMVTPNRRPRGSDQANGSFMARLALGVFAAPILRFYHRGHGHAIWRRAELFAHRPCPAGHFARGERPALEILSTMNLTDKTRRLNLQS